MCWTLDEACEVANKIETILWVVWEVIKDNNKQQAK